MQRGAEFWVGYFCVICPKFYVVMRVNSQMVRRWKGWSCSNKGGSITVVNEAEMQGTRAFTSLFGTSLRLPPLHT